MDEFRFTSDDFRKLCDCDDPVPNYHPEYCEARYAAQVANAKLTEVKKQWLEELLKDAPVVYGHIDSVGKFRSCNFHYVRLSTDAYRARLVCVEKCVEKLEDK